MKLFLGPLPFGPIELRLCWEQNPPRNFTANAAGPADARSRVSSGEKLLKRSDSIPHNFEKKGRVMADDRELLTVKEVGDLLQVHPGTLYKMAREGNIPAFRIGSDWRFRKDAILRWMAEKSMQAHLGESGRQFKS